jgi:hypothetical protein
MQSRNSRGQGSYCDRTTTPQGEDRRHVRLRTRQVSANAATMVVTARLASTAEERHQMALAVRIMNEDRHVLRELNRR